MELLPERRAYAPGETARLQVRMPFREATALVTLEREGVLQSQVVQLSGKSPVIELPIPANAAPNVFVQSCGNTWGQALTWIIVINLFFGGVSSVAVTGRITFALFRDRVFPFADFFSSVNPTLQSPIAAILFDVVFDSCTQLFRRAPRSHI
jgi:hypothetical protein